jgi:sec-independent protein translocase protein TatA
MNASVLLFLNLGGGEIFIILLVIVMLFGSDQLPQLVKSVGRGIREINDAKSQIQNEIQKGAGLSNDVTKQVSEIKEEINTVEQTVKRQMNSAFENSETKS